MADGHGGYRAPSKPNQVSGPGRYAHRTDGGAAQVLSAAPDQPYGAVKQQLDSERAAPMGAQTPMPSAPSPSDVASLASQSQYTGGAFNAPTNRPNEPVTAGAPAGAGPGPEALTFQPIQPGAGTGQMTQLLQRLSATDTTGILGQLMQAAQARGA